MTTPVEQLLERAHLLGADPRTTKFAGGTVSAKGTAVDPVTGADVELMWVRGAGGDLGTFTEDGLAVLRLDRLRALTGVYPGVGSEDEMAAAFEHCVFGKGGSAPPIDTAMHGLLDAPHVDHFHPDAGLAIAAAADGEELTRRVYGDRVVWVPWRRPGFRLGLDIAALKDANPRAVGCVLGGHGITAWGDTSAECAANSLWIIRTAEAYLAGHGRPAPFGPVMPGYEPLPERARRERAAALFPVLRGLCSTDARQVGHYIDTPEVLDFLSRVRHRELAARGTSCPDHIPYTKIAPMVLDLPAGAPIEDVISRLGELHAAYREDYRAYYTRHAIPASPPMHGADPAIVLVPGVGMFSFGPDKQTARVAGEYFRNAINVMRGAEALSAYAPIDETERFRIEYGEKAGPRRLPAPKPLATRVALVTGGGSGIGAAAARRLAAEGACVVVGDRDLAAAEQVAAEIGAQGHRPAAVAVRADVTDEAQVAEAVRQAVLAFGGVDLVVNNAGPSPSRSLLETTVDDWDRRHGVMARGPFLVSRETARVMIDQAMGGDIVYIASGNAVQARQLRLFAAELGEHGIRVNGIDPDGVVCGSGRAALCGVSGDGPGEFHARRTRLAREVLPERVAAAVFALTGGDLPLTTGLHVPVDAGAADAFLR
ncbi:MAG: bifunctional rhamnulose-1-phosphate aldolase/short-chain dehydrogenase [Microbispora sp.]|nr:bifunctional rhamnulose-1-phosphate aldolase/short-chain dehydrogenase [Microbispora sp.]